MKIYNTLIKKKQEFKPLKKGQIKFYYCGPTVYWTQHIGNLRSAYSADLVKRVFEYLDYKVTMVRNYTDVGHLTSDEDSGEDKMEKGAKREGLSPLEIADKYIKIFEQDSSELNINEPEYKPRATGFIKEMIELVQILLDKGFAYTTDLAIYFDVTKAKDYTRLSGQNLEENIKGAGSGEIEDPNKKNGPDFVLWFFKAGAHAKAIQTWESPFESPLVEKGEGFPGWHIECSAMARKYLGDTMDIHMGGIEHIPVHHTNEIAQSESATGKTFSNYWLHNEHLTVDGGKMAKSEGTGYSLAEVKENGYDPLALRYFYLQAHYRSKQNFTWKALESADKGLTHLKNQIRGLKSDKKGKVSKEYKNEFIAKISDDFNLPQAMAVVSELLKSDIADKDKLATVLDFDKVLGLDLDKVGQEKINVPDEVKKLVKDREQARKDKDFDLADKIRKQIEQVGYEVEDSSEGPVVKEK